MPESVTLLGCKMLVILDGEVHEADIIPMDRGPVRAFVFRGEGNIHCSRYAFTEPAMQNALNEVQRLLVEAIHG